MNTRWPADREAAFVEMVAQAMPFAVIGKNLGVTKNAAIGKAHRMELKHPNSPGPRAPKPLTTAERLDALNPFPDPGGCVFPVGHPGEPGFHFCNSTVAIPGAPYCSRCLKRAYLPAERKTMVLQKVGVLVAGRA